MKNIKVGVNANGVVSKIGSITRNEERVIYHSATVALRNMKRLEHKLKSEGKLNICRIDNCYITTTFNCSDSNIYKYLKDRKNLRNGI